MNRSNEIKRIVISGLLLAIGVIVPSIFHMTNIPGNIFLPMHIPVLLGGFLLTPTYAFLLGGLTPIINSMVTGMPVFMPMGIIMMFELATYGLIVSLINSRRQINPIITLLVAMIIGRVVAGLVVFILSTFVGIEFTPVAFVIAAIVKGLPGIVIQLVLIPTLVHLVNRYTTLNIYW